MSLQSSNVSNISPPVLANFEAGGRRERKSRDTKDHIGEIAWSLFDTQGFDVVTMEAIAEAADVAKGTLYKHYPAKEALIQHRIDKISIERRDSITIALLALPTCEGRFKYLFRELEFYLESMRSYVIPYLQYMCAATSVARTPSIFDNALADLLRFGQLSGEIVTDISAENMAEYLAFMRLAALMRWLAIPGSSLREINDEMLTLFLAGASRREQP